MLKDLNRAVKAQRLAGIDIWESRHVVGGRERRRDAKRSNKRARRRLDKALIREAC